jgi:hypothetical protein
MSVPVSVSGTRIVAARPVLLFTGQYSTVVGSRGYDVAKDGRFLMRRRIAENVAERNRRMHPSTLRVILNWTK